MPRNRSFEVAAAIPEEPFRRPARLFPDDTIDLDVLDWLVCACVCFLLPEQRSLKAVQRGPSPMGQRAAEDCIHAHAQRNRRRQQSSAALCQ